MTTKPFLQQIMTDIKTARKHKEDFAFEVTFLGENSPRLLTVDSLEPDYVVFRPFIEKEARGGKHYPPYVITYENILFLQYVGEQK